MFITRLDVGKVGGETRDFSNSVRWRSFPFYTLSTGMCLKTHSSQGVMQYRRFDHVGIWSIERNESLGIASGHPSPHEEEGRVIIKEGPIA
jgi:hypothetical protein